MVIGLLRSGLNDNLNARFVCHTDLSARHSVGVSCSILLAAMVSGDFRLLGVGQKICLSGILREKLRSIHLFTMILRRGDVF